MARGAVPVGGSGRIEAGLVRRAKSRRREPSAGGVRATGAVGIPALLNLCTACMSSGDDATIPPIWRSLFLASCGIVYPLDYPTHVRKRTRGRAGLRGRPTSRQPARNVGREPELLIWRHELLVIRQALRVDDHLLLGLVLS